MQIHAGHAGPSTPSLDNAKAPSEVELWTLALALPVQAHGLAQSALHWGDESEIGSDSDDEMTQECLRAAAEEPRNDWLVEAYTLIGREDLALMARPPREVSGHAAASRRRARDLLDATEAVDKNSAQAQPEKAVQDTDNVKGASWHGGPVEFFRVVRGLFLLAGAGRGNGPAMQHH
ncbi:unnamed protein product [Cladocopium goreaui]|uniref:Uncharacterized protein n=1 Tax=Cladocopium goreaui TaxID=2562237 RepID=A0A9P1GTU8_9DINO|nr:unnamed protein product [Cladocopium goreaui]